MIKKKNLHPSPSSFQPIKNKKISKRNKKKIRTNGVQDKEINVSLINNEKKNLHLSPSFSSVIKKKKIRSP